MATKKRATVPIPSSDNAVRAESETDVETSRSMNVNSDAEHGVSNAPPAVGSVEGPGYATFRVDIERGSENDPGDIERGPA